MPGGRSLAAALAFLLLGFPAVTLAGQPQGAMPGPGGSSLVPIAFADLAGWERDDHAAAFAAFRRTCAVLVDGSAALRPGLPPSADLVAICRRALAASRASLPPGRPQAVLRDRIPAVARRAAGRGRAFRSFDGFLTGYYEPEMEGSRIRSAEFPTPVLARPDDLVTFAPGQTPAGLDPALAAARRTDAGLEPYADRAAIEDGALAGRGLELYFVRDAVELFMAQVQGSARIRLRDGSVERLVYAGRNGHAYTSIGKQIVGEGHMTLEEMTLEKLKAWLRANPADASRIMRMNRSYIFFAKGEGMDPADGPIGAASVPLVPLRSIAVDREPVVLRAAVLAGGRPAGPGRRARAVRASHDGAGHRLRDPGPGPRRPLSRWRRGGRNPRRPRPQRFAHDRASPGGAAKVTTRRRRTLTSDEHALWTHVTRHVAPIDAKPRQPRTRAAAAQVAAPQTEAARRRGREARTPAAARQDAQEGKARSRPGTLYPAAGALHPFPRAARKAAAAAAFARQPSHRRRHRPARPAPGRGP